MATMLERVQAMIRGEAPNPPVAGLVSFRALEVSPGRAVFETETGPQHANPMGTLHGGSSGTSPMPPWALPMRPR